MTSDTKLSEAVERLRANLDGLQEAGAAIGQGPFAADLRTVLDELREAQAHIEKLRGPLLYHFGTTDPELLAEVWKDRDEQYRLTHIDAVNEMAENAALHSAPRNATVGDVTRVEEIVGMGCGAWDTIDPARIIEAAWSLRSAPRFTQEDVRALRSAADEVVQVNNLASPLSYQAAHAKYLRDLASRISQHLEGQK